MIEGIFVSSAALNVQQERLDLLSQDLENINTCGYKKRSLIIENNFKDLVNSNTESLLKKNIKDIPEINYSGLAPFIAHDYTDFSPAVMKETKVPTDFALNSEGFFVIQTSDNEQYTRNGTFSIDADGYLVNISGNKVLGEDGPLKTGAQNFLLAKDGAITVNGQSAGKIRVVTFEEPQLLLYEGSGCFSQPSQGAGLKDEENPQISRGFLELANVDLPDDMVNMIEISRTYEANQRVIRTQDDLLGKAIQIGNAK
ncbi:MAG: Flagellar basal body rod protein FlgG [Desulfotomaculum sp. 46_80]|nr:MAG: Flagellar basal body rod protein FlgG [Desulfotomaculum sp. 46_80]